ncbi:putative ABC transporter [Violaceomyces palustris]|uniref:ABC transporter n=1 Tax=Violaceomyces palustris TaxID=1673888 RepID=A0ACD0P076_9BASI|nr:putative ABC transporter [Violaceomyces palustris]
MTGSLQGYPGRSWWRKVPFVSTRPRPFLSAFSSQDDRCKLSPEYGSGLLSQLSFSWLDDLLTVGYTRPLDEQDLFKLGQEKASKLTGDRLLRSFDERWSRQRSRSVQIDHQDKQEGNPPPPPPPPPPPTVRVFGLWELPILVLAMNDVISSFFWLGGLMKLLSDVGTITSPLLVRSIIDFITDSYQARSSEGVESPSIGKGLALALTLLVTQALIVLLNVHAFYRGFGSGILLRSSLIHAIFSRSMRLSNRSRSANRLSVGKLVTFISSDVTRIDYSCQFFHMAWTCAVQVLICIALLIWSLGYSSLPGIAILILFSPIQTQLTKRLFSLRKRSMIWTERRNKAIDECISGIRLIKQFAWESHYLQKVRQLRVKEMAFLRNRLFLRSFNLALAFATPTLASVISFITYSATGHDLEPGVIFSSLSFFQLLRTPLQFLPISWNALVDAKNASDRLSVIFTSDEQPKHYELDLDLDVALKVEHATFEWEEGKDLDDGPPAQMQNTPFTLEDVNLTIPRGSLCVVIGSVGSGKSSFINALAGEMRKVEGTLKHGGSLGVCSQTAWIQSSTIRDNILFGRPFDAAKYQTVLDKCCLLKDLEMFSDGDMTVVGEKGLSLSGGQKQRINLARTLYHDDDIVLLDDCFSALDTHVGKRVFEGVILGEMGSKTRVLSTHSLHLLKKGQVDQVILLENGRIKEQGLLEDLLSSRAVKGEIFRLFTSHSSKQDLHDLEKDDGEEEEKGILGEGKGPDVDPGDEDQDVPIKGSTGSTGKEDHKAGSPIMQAEERNTGSVTVQTYYKYFSSAPLHFLLPLFCFAVLVFQGSTIMSPVWLLWWQEKHFELPQGVYMGLYAIIGMLQSVGLLCMGLIFGLFTVYSSIHLHDGALESVLRAPFSFFDTTPQGRITHRFSKDMDSLDNVIGEAIRTFVGTVVQVVGCIVLIAILTPWFLIAVAVLLLAFVWTGMYYRSSARELRRLDALLRSKMHEHFSESLNGQLTIRSFSEVDQFESEVGKRIDDQNRAYWLSMSCQRWLSLRLDLLGSLLVFAVALVAVLTRFEISPGETGVALSYILTAQSIFGWMIRHSAEVENNMNAVERVIHYNSSLPREPAPFQPEADSTLPKDWPSQGRILFHRVQASYRPGLPPVLRGVSFEILPGEKVAVCGRTGAGKSTLVTTLLRIMEISSGRIEIDGVDISTLGLERLRRSISLIPQDATLFSGTLRYNLDPTGESDDATLWDALRRVCLISEAHGQVPTETDTSTLTEPTEKVPVAESGATPDLHLEMSIHEDGSNLSVGQRCLVSMARALVKRSRIVILDEATASIDFETDQKIQKVLREDLRECTTLTVAHRLNTVVGYADKVCVMDQGEIVEVGKPEDLYQREDSIFRSMCQSSHLEFVEGRWN